MYFYCRSSLSWSKLQKIAHASEEKVEDENRRKENAVPEASQDQDESTFFSDTWSEMLRDCKLDESDPNSMINKYNVAWAKRKTCPGNSKKIPMLSCVLKSIDLSSIDPTCQIQVQGVIDWLNIF